jgi:putative PIN family toxin of toxin-antitoxin system
VRVILDTNLLVSALLVAGSVPARVLDAWFDGQFTLLTCDEQLDELRRVTRHPRIRPHIEPAVAASLVNDLRHFADLIEAMPRVDVSTDPADNFLLAMAEAGRADFLVTGDRRDVLALKRHGATRILSARNFLAILHRDHG